MENYIYRRWFQPYRTEVNVSHVPFLCRFIKPFGLPRGMAEPSSIVVDRLVRFNNTPYLPQTLPTRNAGIGAETKKLEEYIFVKTTLEMSDRMNADGFSASTARPAQKLP
ncbi:hypothetical protein B0T16DRAFT_453349 [Cercophora newfieldiana]|uniref:Uncharacterized protein n=1 Tax=Cercophora newfieldiana TaxID=92897 RepID=A0AA40D2K5_9PEZI|nr:hypothetical protein B0T16DRAFT_453349 [Cercophora newfieldiana]